MPSIFRASLRSRISAVALAALVASALVPAHGFAAKAAPTSGHKSRHSTRSCPLTGETAPGGIRLRRPAVVVKVDNSPASPAASGIAGADLVIESLVEGGITRFSAVYHCGDAESVGPVRSARYDDAQMLAPYSLLLAISGANESVAGELEDAGMLVADEESGLLERRSDDEFGLFTDTRSLRELAMEEDLDAPKTEMEFDALPRRTHAATHVTLTFAPTNVVEYRWENGEWFRYENGERVLDANGRPLSADNLVVQGVDTNESWLTDANGVASPEMTLDGAGRAWLFRSGRVMTGRWNDNGFGHAPTYSSARGGEFSFARGNTFIALLPSAEGALTGSLSYE